MKNKQKIMIVCRIMFDLFNQCLSWNNFYKKVHKRDVYNHDNGFSTFGVNLVGKVC